MDRLAGKARRLENWTCVCARGRTAMNGFKLCMVICVHVYVGLLPALLLLVILIVEDLVTE